MQTKSVKKELNKSASMTIDLMVPSSEICKPKILAVEPKADKPRSVNAATKKARARPQPVTDTVSLVASTPVASPLAASSSVETEPKSTHLIPKSQPNIPVLISPLSTSVSGSPSVNPASSPAAPNHPPRPVTPAPRIENRPTPTTPTRVARCYVSAQAVLDSRANDRKPNSILKSSRSKPAVRVSPLYTSLSCVQTREELLSVIVARAGSRRNYATKKGKLTSRSMHASAAVAPTLSAELPSPSSESIWLGVTDPSAAHEVVMEIEVDLNTGVTMDLGMDVDPVPGMDVDMVAEIEVGNDVWMSELGVEDTVMEIVPPVAPTATAGIVHQSGYLALQSSMMANSQPTAWFLGSQAHGGHSELAASPSVGPTNTPTSYLPSGRSKMSMALFPYKNIIWSLDEAGRVPTPVGGLKPGTYIWRRDPDRMAPAIFQRAPKRFCNVR
ncbi:hypothetical protein BDV93DRAFT_546469 [Ceratobasidium sp. AG-I]|nr:hypothetical protein BDV93DRAFT_546469 [Ceratobasidium sp. AG-I]